MVFSEDSLYYKIADAVNEFSRKVLRETKYFLATVMVICTVIVSIVWITQTACA